MKRLFLLLLCLPLIGFSQDAKEISGIITDGNNPMPDVTISVIGGDTATRTDGDGRYRIEARTGDVLRYTYVGMKPIEVLVEDVTRYLNLVMIPYVEELDEVIVQSSRRRSQVDLRNAYNIDKDIIKTAFGYLDKRTVGGSMSVLSEDQINSGYLCILDLLRANLPGVQVQGDCISGGRLIIRGYGSITNPAGVIYDVDGNIFTSAPIWIAPATMKRVAIIQDLGSSAKYGGFGGGGVVVINTVASNIQRFEDGKSYYDFAKLRNNYVTGTVLNNEDIKRSAPVYIRQLDKAVTSEEAKQAYEAYLPQYSSYPYFFLDAYKHFYEQRSDHKFADTLKDKFLQKFGENAVYLKALAYILQAQHRHLEAHEIYMKLFVLRPGYLQSYRDLADSYRTIKQYKKAATLYSRYGLLREQGKIRDSLPIHTIVDREYNNLLSLQSKEIVGSERAQSLFIEEEEFLGTRLVFEWNDSEAEFKLQFVNPDNQYYTWEHTLEAAEETIRLEKFNGFSTSEYLIDESLPGRWQVNATYLGNKSLTPTYLKVTRYEDYGTPRQSRKITVHKLMLEGVNQRLIEFNKSGNVRSRR